MDIIDQLEGRVHSAEYGDAMTNSATHKQDLRRYDAAKREELALPKLATINEIEQVENRIGFPLPEIVRRVYLEARNGDFNHPILDLTTAASEYLTSLADREHSHLEWPSRLLPFLNWGCDIYSCLDCSSPHVPITRVDYNHDVPEMRQGYILNPGFHFFEPYANDAVAAWVEAETVEEWFSDWLAGVDLFHRAYPATNPRSK